MSRGGVFVRGSFTFAQRVLQSGRSCRPWKREQLRNYLSPNINARPENASPWACWLAALLVVCLGLNLAALIATVGQPTPASLPAGGPPLPAVAATLPPAP